MKAKKKAWHKRGLARSKARRAKRGKRARSSSAEQRPGDQELAGVVDRQAPRAVDEAFRDELVARDGEIARRRTARRRARTARAGSRSCRAMSLRTSAIAAIDHRDDHRDVGDHRHAQRRRAWATARRGRRVRRRSGSAAYAPAACGQVRGGRYVPTATAYARWPSRNAPSPARKPCADSSATSPIAPSTSPASTAISNSSIRAASRGGDADRDERERGERLRDIAQPIGVAILAGDEHGAGERTQITVNAIIMGPPSRRGSARPDRAGPDPTRVVADDETTARRTARRPSRRRSRARARP